MESRCLLLLWLLALAGVLAGGPVSAQAADRDAPVHNVDGSFVREWLILGPIPSKDMEFDFLADVGGEANVRPKEDDSVTLKDGTRLTWTRFRSDRDVIDLERLVGIQTWSVAYVYCELNSDRTIETDLRGECGWATSLWLNGIKIGGIPVKDWRHHETDILPVLPIRLNAGRNACLLKLKRELERWSFRFQPLPSGRATAELRVTDPVGRGIAEALVEFYDGHELAGRLTTDDSGKAEACFYPSSGVYDLHVTSTGMDSWVFNVSLPPGERRTLNVALTNAISIFGRVLALDGSPQNSIVVQAVFENAVAQVAQPAVSPTASRRRGEQSSVSEIPNARGLATRETADWQAALQVEAEPKLSSANGGKIQSLLPTPFFSATAHTDTNGNYRFVNLHPGKYRLRVHGLHGFVYAGGVQESDPSEPILIEPGWPPREVNFRIPEIKKGVWKAVPFATSMPLSHESIYRTPDGALWIGTSDYTFQAYDGVEFKTVALTNEPNRTVIAMTHAADGSLWVGSSRGISQVVAGQRKSLSFSHQLPRPRINDVHVAPDGTVWFGTASGLGTYDGREFVVFTVKDGLPDNEVRSLSQTRDGALWIGTGTGLSRFDGRRFSELEWFRRSGLEGAASLHEARDGAIWFRDPLVDRGAFRYDGKTLWHLGTAEGLPDNNVWSIEPSSDGGMWVGTEKELARYRDGQIEDLREKLGITTGAVWEVRHDPDDTLWISSAQGLHILEPILGPGGVSESPRPERTLTSLRLSPMRSGPRGNDALPSEGRADLRVRPELSLPQHESQDTSLKGFRRISITATNGLPDQDIRCSARTRDGIIWMGSYSRGLLGYDGKAITAIDPRDGPVGNQVVALMPDEDGTLWVGSNDGGLIHYRRTKTPPSVRLLDVQVDDQKLTAFSNLPRTEIGKRIAVRYQEIDLMTHPDKRQFWYQVIEPSGQTLYAGVTKDRHFEWTPRKGGSYSFEVQSIDRDLNYSKPAQVTFLATVPWYANAWILAPGGSAFAGLIVWAFIARALYLRQRREAERLRERARLARDLHDHLGAGLSHVAMLGDFVRQQSDQPGAAQELAARLSESAHELSRTMGEVIWTTDPAKDTLRSFVSFVASYAEKFFAAGNPRLRLDFPAEIPSVIFPAQFRHSLFMVAKEALNNAGKHAHASEVRVKLELRDREMCLSFEDDGRGFLKSDVAGERNGLVNMQKRLRDLGGDLQIESTVGQGTRVQARVPLPKK